MRTGSFVGKIYWSNGERIPSIPVPKTRDWRLFPCLSADYWRLFRIAPLKVKRAPASLAIKQFNSSTISHGEATTPSDMTRLADAPLLGDVMRRLAVSSERTPLA